MDVSEDVVSTLRAEARHPPVLLDEHPCRRRLLYGTQRQRQGRRLRGGNIPQTLRAGVVPAAIAPGLPPGGFPYRDWGAGKRSRP